MHAQILLTPTEMTPYIHLDMTKAEAAKIPRAFSAFCIAIPDLASLLLWSQQPMITPIRSLTR